MAWSPVGPAPTPGGVVEWLMAPVLKTGEVKASAGSNPAPSVPENPVLERLLGH